MVSYSVKKTSITLLCVGISEALATEFTVLRMMTGPKTMPRFTLCILFTKLYSITLEQK